jgi:hypothetical protein
VLRSGRFTADLRVVRRDPDGRAVQYGNDDGRPSHEFDRRSMLRKLAVGGSVVWVSPMIARRASALMPPSQCVNGAQLNWSEIFPNTNPEFGNAGPAVLTNVDGSGVDITISSSIVGTTALAGNFDVVDSPHGGITGKSLLLEQRPVPNTDAPGGGGSDGLGGQTVTITFSTTVRNISFTITDIDNTNNWSDRITTITAPTSTALGGNVIGIGATGNGTGGFNTNDQNGGSNAATGAFRNDTADDNLPNSSNLGNLTLNYAGPIAAVSFRYWCGGVGAGANSSNQLIRLGNIGFDTCPEGVTPNVAPVQSPAVESEPRVGRRSDDPPAPTPDFDS